MGEDLPWEKIYHRREETISRKACQEGALKPLRTLRLSESTSDVRNENERSLLSLMFQFITRHLFIEHKRFAGGITQQGIGPFPGRRRWDFWGRCMRL